MGWHWNRPPHFMLCCWMNGYHPTRCRESLTNPKCSSVSLMNLAPLFQHVAQAFLLHRECSGHLHLRNKTVYYTLLNSCTLFGNVVDPDPDSMGSLDMNPQHWYLVTERRTYNRFTRLFCKTFNS
jgi:hypothetical protein